MILHTFGVQEDPLFWNKAVILGTLEVQVALELRNFLLAPSKGP